MVTTTHHDSNQKDKVNFRWNIEGIEMPDRKKSIQGNWNFALTVKSVDSKERTIGGSSEKEGIKANMEKVAMSPVSFILYYNQEVSKDARKEWDSVDVELTVKDDLGMIIRVKEMGKWRRSLQYSMEFYIPKVKRKCNKAYRYTSCTLASSYT